MKGLISEVLVLFGILFCIAGCSEGDNKCEQCNCEQNAGEGAQGDGGVQPEADAGGQPDAAAGAGTKAEGDLCDDGSECGAGLACISPDPSLPSICARRCALARSGRLVSTTTPFLS